MNTLQTFGELLTASEEELTLTYRLLPYGEEGHTNLGAIKASKGVLQIPTDFKSLQLNEEHDFTKPIGFFESVTEEESGLTASVRLIDTQAGRDAHKLARAGLRTGISVEIAEPLIRDGNLMAGRLTGAGLVVRPAFANAQLTAADCGSLPEKEPTMETNSETLEAAEAPSVVQAAPIHASASRVELGSMTFDAYNAGGAPAINAALADLKTTNDAGKAYIADQELGELWTARVTQRPLVNAVGIKPLTSLVQTGTKKQRTFAVANWAGNKVELPTAVFTTSRETWTASAKAVAVDIAAELIEFGGAGVISELYEEAMDSYITQTEAELLTYLVNNSTAVTGVTSAIAAIDRASETLGNIGAQMSFIAVAPNVMAALRSVTSANAPWWLASQGAVNLRDRSIDLGGVTLVSNASLANGTILVGDSRAVDYRESKDIKFQALDVPRGGVDISFIKFRSQKVTDAGAILKFTGVTGA
jgi:hypothetical protein